MIDQMENMKAIAMVWINEKAEKAGE